MEKYIHISFERVLLIIQKILLLDNMLFVFSIFNTTVAIK
jgi:hypothetical protein